MNRQEVKVLENYFEAFLVLSLIIGFLYIIKDFLLVILIASILVFLTYPMYKWFVKKTKSEFFSALDVLIIICTILLIPFYVVITLLLAETSTFIQTGTNIIEKIDLSGCDLSACRTIENYFLYLDESIETTFNFVGNSLLSSANVIFSSISDFLIKFFVFLISIFYLLKDGDKFLKYLKRIIPMKSEYKNALFLRFRDVNSAVFKDSILVALMQGTLLGIGFYLFGISSPMFWGAIASFFALIPVIGTAIVWVPVLIYFLLTGIYIKAIVFFLYCGIIVGLSDNLVRPYLIKRKIQVHPLLILISILGGMQVFGFMGVFVGPIIISLMISVLQLYKLDFK